MIARRIILVLVIASLACNRGEPKRETSPDIILITIDTLRADSLGFAGRSDVETPFLDRLARESVVFTNAHAHNVVTLPSHANILTGLYPYQHGIRDNAGYKLDPKFATAATLLKQKGYATGAFIGAFPLDARFGLTRGFDVYDDKYPEGKGRLDFKVAERSAEEVLAAAAQWWRAQRGPRFLWAHVYDPHAPYAPPEPFAARYAGRLYLGEIAYVDSMLSRFIAPLIQPETMVIVTADHGEALGDHGELTHGLFAYEATLKVPLLARDPASLKGRSDNRPARHVDILPTLLERAGITKPTELPGQSLLAQRPGSSTTYFEALSASLNRGWAPLVGMIDQGHKYIDLPLPELYDLAADPAEASNLVSERRRVTTQLRSSLAAAAPKPAGDRSLSPDQTAELQSLGYLAGSAAKKSYTVDDDPKKLVEIDGMMHGMVEMYQRGERAQAIETGRQIVQRQPDMVVGREMLAFMLQEAEQPEAAIATLQEAVKRGSATESLKIRLGLLYSETGRAKEAVEILAPFANKDEVDVLNAYGIALSDVGRGDEATRQFERVLAVDPTNATAHQNMGIVALRAGNAQLAEQHLTRALAIDAQMPLALNTLGVVYARSGRPAQAFDAWRKATAIDPRLYDALFNLAVVAGQNERWDIARQSLQQFIKTAPPKRYARELVSARQMLEVVERRERE